ncbi:hypothetical protein GCM10007160_14730 [Litchfieldella qijiaojingensis]|uniref:Uncharacterized protein n=1 Tax=Litchfieldella qijiaojingensis TaxID=980347 RepID=A0ABQ2YMU8_9GAMM|nr:hypothetical protein [Halomonas qijiaojingensis]GGX88328.1 hypothetical protein GCM10007160_14730 [Halomonas qijiaojingensis]
MAKKTATELPKPSGQPHRAGDTEGFFGGRTLFLAPLPLPAGGSRVDFSQGIGELNEVWLDYGVGWPRVSGWQVLLGGYISSFILIVFGLPLGMAAMTSNEDYPFWSEFIYHFYDDLEFSLFVVGCVFILLVGYWPLAHMKRRRLIPVRLNRQRREVCFVPQSPDGRDAEAPVFVPWEAITAWVVEAQGASQYGVHRHYGMGFGHFDAERERWLSLEVMTAALPMAISNWEALRAYMDYEVDSLAEIQDPLGIRRPDDPPWEGVHTVRNARRKLHERRRNGEVGWIYVVFWYLWYLVELGPLPGYLAEGEAWLLRRRGPKALPPEMVEWSKPLPKEQWAQPSEELVRLAAEARRLRRLDPRRPVAEIFAEVYRGKGVVA